MTFSGNTERATHLDLYDLYETNIALQAISVRSIYPQAVRIGVYYFRMLHRYIQ